jgi:hypothetical protein
LHGQEFAGGTLSVQLGRTSRFGARYFRLMLDRPNGECSQQAVLTALHRSGPLPSYNWVEVAETNDRLTFPDGTALTLDGDSISDLWRLLFELLPPGGHLMVEYDSPSRADTAEGLAHNTPAVATPLGEDLYRAGFGAHFKDWQIAEGGSEGPRKLQAYKPLSKEDADRWRAAAIHSLDAFLQRGGSVHPYPSAAERASRLREQLAEQLAIRSPR